MTVKDYILLRRDRLVEAGIQCADPLLHMKQILELGLGWDTATLYTRWHEVLTSHQMEELDRLVERRCGGEPFQYLAGCEWFWDAKFRVGPGVFIPRRETECLVEQVLARESRPQIRAAELGVGSGIIGITLLRECPGWVWDGFEACESAWPFIESNLGLLPPEASYRFHRGDFFDGVAAFGPYDWWISNPPYVQQEGLESLPKEVQREPVMALDGGPGGLVVVRRWLELGRQCLVPGGKVIFEFSPEQSAPAKDILHELGYREIEEYRDYADWVRGLVASWPGTQT